MELTLKEAQETKIFYIENGKIESTNLAYFVNESVDITTTPRGVAPRVFIENETILKPGMILGVREWKEKYKVLGLFCGGNVLLKEENHLLCGYAPNELKTLENLRAASTFNWYIIE